MRIKSKLQKLKRALGLVMCLYMMLTLTSCGLPKELEASLETNFTGRATQNENIAKELYGAGIISETTYDRIIKSIDDNLRKLSSDVASDKSSAQNLLKAVVGWRIVPEDDHPVYDTDGSIKYYYHSGTLTPTTVYDAREQCESWYGQFLTNYLVNYDISMVENNVPAVGGNSGKINPIEVIPESLVEQLNKELSIPIYALKGSITGQSGEGLDVVIAAIEAASQEKNQTKAEQLIAQYFEAVTYKDSSGNKREATLLDPSDPEQQLVRVTSQTYDVGYDFDGTKFDMKTVDAATSKNGSTINFPTTSSDVGNEPGIDMVVFTAGEPIMTVRLVEFNSKAVAELRARTGLSEKRYLVVNGRAYLMEYPLGYIDGFKETEDGTAYDSVIKRSGLGFNLLTGNFTKYNKDADGNYTNESVVVSKEDPYLTYDGAQSEKQESQSSLVLYGETGVTGQKGSDGQEIDEELNEPFNLSFGTYKGEEVIASVGRIVLRDYLEFTYAPEVVSGENIVALGRKLRIMQLSGAKNNVVAQFYDKEGKLLEGSAKLFIDDFADLLSVIEDDTVKYISKEGKASGLVPGSGTQDKTEADQTENTEAESQENESSEATTETATEVATEAATETTENTETETEDETDKELTSGMDPDDKIEVIQSSASKIDKMKLETVEQISCSSEFPGEYIAKSDVNLTDEKPLFYGMIVRASMFETGLFSGWVQSTDNTQNSTVWWNKWLGEHGFNYNINSDNLVNFLKGNYAYDLSQENIVILDLETISKIQQEYQAQDQLANAHFIRAMFIGFGYILIAYALVLLIAWNIDINVDLGFNILEKLSFGKWVAVKEYDEVPFVDDGDTKFMKFSTLLISCIFIMAVGMILIQFNIITIILEIIKAMGGIASYISKMLLGV